ncbi:alpha/beta hydrolase family esterase [Streptomyces sp. NPDC086989]|uniref:alpha/beta hydrolase family esterase n=1 Tax=Streptomyces sp. NPDC086989 TaxID=3365764 RepID=UPI0037F4C472
MLGAAYGAVVSRQSLDIGGLRRSFTVVRPVPARENAPVVLVFHGAYQSARTLRLATRRALDGVVNTSGAIVAYLDSHRWHWNDARVDTSFAARTAAVDEVSFTTAVIDRLGRSHGADVSRVHAVGFSNGGYLVFRLLHEIPERLAGAAVIAATQPVAENFAPRTSRIHPLPTLLIHGTGDRVVPYGGGRVTLGGRHSGGTCLSARETAEYYARRNGVDVAAVSAMSAVSAVPAPSPCGRGVYPTGIRTDLVEYTEFRQDPHPPVVLCTVHGGGHAIPTAGRTLGSLLRQDRRGFDSVRVIGDFFGLAVRPAPPGGTPGGGAAG